MKTILIGSLHPEAERVLENNTTLTKLTTEQFYEINSSEAQALVLRTFTHCHKKDLDKFHHLKYIVSCSVGLDNLDLEEIKRRQIELIHCPGSNANSVAEHTLNLILSILRKNTPFAELKNKTIGIIGFGHIGRQVARKLQGFETRIIAFDVIQPEANILNELKVEMKPFEAVIEESDIVSVHVPLNKHTAGLISSSAFSLMKKNSFFINTSRAEVVDEPALIAQLEAKKFRGVALDVYSENLKLAAVKYNHLILTDHAAAQGEDSFREQCLQPVNKLIEKLDNKY
ncbi:MAG TPA: NAD(P)-dependent oxidoreductase [Candidatus Nanoarchaeia archaeon]|nr:NAD(P)-dependent oxidoreductase [Candidatus Nanoarchaeia archaeon]